MAIDAELVGILNDLVKFLELLSKEINLPDTLENDRSNLLRRSKTSLASAGQRSSSPEPYLDMNAGKGKGLSVVKSGEVNTINDNNNHQQQLTEYIDTDNPRVSRHSAQDYYETFQEFTSKSSANDEQDKLKIIYRSFSTEQTRSKSHKCGPLFQKEERRLFGFQLFDQFRELWVGLVGTHLLLYATKNDKQPSDVISIRGYSARPATDYAPRDSERSKSAFEIFCPGDKTYQFIARTPKEMEQWIAIICRTGVKKEAEAETNGVDLQPKIEEEYQDVGAEAKENEAIEEVELRKKETIAGVNGDVNPPPLPARIPRRLPSLPHEDKSVDFTDEAYYEDDIYQMVEELKQPTTYQNVTKVKIHKDKGKVSPALDTYDDIAGKKERKTKRKSKSYKDNYDDMQADEIKSQVQDERTSVMYDDIEAVDCKNTKESSKKKSFLNRVRYKKDSKKKKIKNLPKEVKLSVKDIKPDSQDTKPDIQDAKPDIRVDEKNNRSVELPTYDDVSDLMIQINKNTIELDNMAEYNCPPAPRPIYSKPPTIPNPVKFNEEPEEFYDDIGSWRNTMEEKLQNNNEIVETEVTVESSLCINDEQSRVKNLSQSELWSKTNGVDNELEHYQVPRSQDPIDSGQLDVTGTTNGSVSTSVVQEELYDDIAILADFRARSRDSGCSSSSSDKTVNNVTKAWNRFASGRKSKVINELTIAEKNNRRSSSQEFIDACLDNHEDEGFKLNKFQKLINKMESSLNITAKPISSIISKSHDHDDN
ncbi:uncharacterized protein LOC103573488 [Microplitis demolitor]|uniref:uncharacterized protein LOC103573488 n=1 Tax=Microplitis demolitor TaxID=69319 RepID=UPI0004CCA397|nr:uncharacterized protein LOC103573488 [Microplitis demolitor]